MERTLLAFCFNILSLFIKTQLSTSTSIILSHPLKISSILFLLLLDINVALFIFRFSIICNRFFTLAICDLRFCISLSFSHIIFL
jgi:hypothetical protein